MSKSEDTAAHRQIMHCCLKHIQVLQLHNSSKGLRHTSHGTAAHWQVHTTAQVYYCRCILHKKHFYSHDTAAYKQSVHLCSTHTSGRAHFME